MLDASLPDSNDDRKGWRTNTGAMHSSCSSLALNEHNSTRLAQKHSQHERNGRKCANCSTPCGAALSFSFGDLHNAKILTNTENLSPYKRILLPACTSFCCCLLQNFILLHTRDDEHFHHIFIRHRIKARKVSRHVIGSFVSPTSQLHVAWHRRNFQCFATVVLVWVHTRRW